MASHYEFLIVGGGLAAAHAMKELVRRRPGASIGLIAEEKEPPYDRPPLSKDYLLGKMPRDRLFLLKKEFFDDHGIDVMLGQRAVRVDATGHKVITEDGMESGYDRLLLSSGCSLRRLACPGTELEGLYYLRTLPESDALRHAAGNGRQAVIIGAGFIGLEVASVLSQLGVSVTVIHRGDRLFEKFSSEEISTYYEEMFAARGVHTVYKDEAAELSGTGRIESVITRDGRILPCDFAVAGIGVFPDTSYLNGSGVKTGNGVIVDDHLRTSDPDIYAAGDIANFFDGVYGRQRRLEHWDNAIRQGKMAAANMAGDDQTFYFVSYFYSTVFGETFECFGDMSDHDQIILRGSFEKKSAAVFYLREGVIQSVFLLGRSMGERTAAKRLIGERRQLGGMQDRLADEDFDLEKALAA